VACGARNDLDAGSFELTLEPASITLTQGGPAVVANIHVVRARGFVGAVNVNVSSLPPGVIASNVAIPAGVSDASIALTASLDATQGAGAADVTATATSVASHDVALTFYVRGCAGCLDTTFGVGGTASIRGGAITMLAIDASDAVHVLAFVKDGDVGLSRFTASGAFDSDFGLSGYVMLPSNVALAIPRSMTSANDASTVIATTSSTLMRVTPKGEWDLAFGVNGVASLPTSGQLFAVDTLGDGTFLATGRQQQNEAWLLRTSGTGALDPSFGAGGEVVTTWVGVAKPARALKVGANIFVGGTSTTSAGPTFALARYSADGAPDAAFTAPTISGTVRDMIATRSSTIVLAGDSVSQPRLARYDSSGTLDTSFGDAGIATMMGAFTQGVMSMAAEQSDGSILILGNDGVPLSPTNYLVRLRANGTLDSSFADAGALIVGGPAEETMLTCLGLQSDGRIVVGGFEFDAVNGEGYATLQRYWP
jgi:uncharacterized delta-60 repeat protein